MMTVYSLKLEQVEEERESARMMMHIDQRAEVVGQRKGRKKMGRAASEERNYQYLEMLLRHAGLAFSP